MLRASLLKFGDVILSSGFHLKDSVVVMATRKGLPSRRYAHAAFVCSPSIWIESTGEGTGLTYLDIFQRDNQQLIDVSHYRTLDVFRLPDPALEKIDWFAENVQELLKDFIGFQYPQLDALAETSTWLKSLPVLKRQLLKSASQIDVVNPGAFCSELVVELFEAFRRAGMIKEGLLITRQPSRNISPNDLADDTLSRLRKESLILIDLTAEQRPDSLQSQAPLEPWSGNSAVSFGNQMRAAVIQSKTTLKQIQIRSSHIDEITDGLLISTAAAMNGSGVTLLVSEGNPFVEDVSDRPELGEIQRAALKSGTNPAWARLEGLASFLTLHVSTVSTSISDLAKLMFALLDQVNTQPRSKIASLLWKHTKGIQLGVRAVQEGTLAINHLEVSQGGYLRGFPSDELWIDYMSAMSDGLSRTVKSLAELIGSVRSVWSTARGLSLIQRTLLKRYLERVTELKGSLDDYANAIDAFQHALTRLSVCNSSQTT